MAKTVRIRPRLRREPDEDVAEQTPAQQAFENASVRIEPQDGPQYDFLMTPADIAIYGGAAGSGKSYALQLDPIRHLGTAGFAAVIFRRHTTEIRNPGGLWDESLNLFSRYAGAEPVEHVLEWRFPAGAKIKFAHLEYDKTVFDWHGSQVPLICFDELTTFTSYQFWYMVSRNRSTCGVPPYIRATCNPDADSWVAKLISWWIDQDTGFPIPERAGRLRWFVRVGDELYWASDPKDLSHERLGVPRVAPNGDPIELLPKSLTFIPANIYNNKVLLKKDPGYLANLMALPTVERERLLKGNWKIKPSRGLYFKRQWIEVVDAVPAGLTIVRGWDLAATEDTGSNDPDWTCGTKIGKTLDGTYYVLDHVYMRGSPQKVELLIKNTASQDGAAVTIAMPQDPGQAGKSQIAYLVRQLPGYTVKSSPEQGDKTKRFSPFSSQAEAGNVKVLRGSWNERWFATLEAFPESAHDDDIDSTSRAFGNFFQSYSGMVDWMQQQAQARKDQIADMRKGEPPATAENGGVRVVAPSDAINLIYDMKGRAIRRASDGTFIVTEKHGESLCRQGWKKVGA